MSLFLWFIFPKKKLFCFRSSWICIFLIISSPFICLSIYKFSDYYYNNAILNRCLLNLIQKAFPSDKILTLFHSLLFRLKLFSFSHKIWIDISIILWQLLYSTNHYHRYLSVIQALESVFIQITPISMAQLKQPNVCLFLLLSLYYMKVWFLTIIYSFYLSILWLTLK